MSDADRLKWQSIAKASLQELAEKDVYPVDLLKQVQDKLSAYRAAQ